MTKTTIQTYTLPPTTTLPTRIKAKTSGGGHTLIFSIHTLENELLDANHPTPYDTQTLHTRAANHLINQPT